MWVLASADVHGSRPVYDWLITVAREHHVEAIVLAGDFAGMLGTRVTIADGRSECRFLECRVSIEIGTRQPAVLSQPVI
jgi:Icc-related predicted phosphoesterase